MRQSMTIIYPHHGDRRTKTFFAYLPYRIHKNDWITDSQGTRRQQYTDETRWLERVTVEMKFYQHGLEEGRWLPERFVD